MKPAFQRRAFWSLAGLFLLGFAGWEAVQIARGGRTAPSKALPPPQRRSGERPALVREAHTGDPIANYLARAKRGMTEQEVRCMLEDFEAAGLDQAYGIGFGEWCVVDLPIAQANCKKLEEWYLAALSDGLSFTPAQKEEAKSKIDALLVRDFQFLQEMVQANPTWREAPPVQLFEDENLMKRFDRVFGFEKVLFFDSQFAPWGLVQLTEEQAALTLRFWFLEDWKREIESDPWGGGAQAEPAAWLYAPRVADPSAEPGDSTLYQMPGLPAMQDPLTGNLIEFSNFTGFLARGERNEAYLPCGNILPLTPDQMPFWEKSYDLAAQALLCHPAQLRLALLQQPGLAQTLRKELDRESSQNAPTPPVKPAASAVSE